MLLERIDAMEVQFIGATQAIEAVGKETDLYRRSGQRLIHLINLQRQEITRQQSRLKERGEDQDDWHALRALEAQCKVLFEECLAYLQAVRARGKGVDADLCHIADALLVELTQRLGKVQWTGFTILAADESFRDLAEVIRLRYPASGIWDLPVAVHEFGHFVTGWLNLKKAEGDHVLGFPRLRDEFLREHSSDSKKWASYLDEYFADVFATYVLGPAYAFTTLRLRFDAVGAHTESDGLHPSYAKRAYAVLEMLRLLNKQEDCRGDFDAALKLLREKWSQQLTSAGEEAAIEADGKVEDIVFRIYQMLDEGVPQARYNRWKLAEQLDDLLGSVLGDSKVDIAVAVADRGYAGKLSISDALNAAWLCRLRRGIDVRKLEQALEKLVQISLC